MRAFHLMTQETIEPHDQSKEVTSLIPGEWNQLISGDESATIQSG